MRLTPGARTLVRTLKRMGMRTAIVSGGFTHVTDFLAAELGVDHSAANALEVADGKLTGRLVGDIVDRPGKARILQEIATREGIPLEQVVAVGDGANDLDMLAVAGLGIAFIARSAVKADVALNVPYLDALVPARHTPKGSGGEEVGQSPCPGCRRYERRRRRRLRWRPQPPVVSGSPPVWRAVSRRRRLPRRRRRGARGRQPAGVPAGCLPRLRFVQSVWAGRPSRRGHCRRAGWRMVAPDSPSTWRSSC